MANEEHVDILGQGVDAWNQWRKRNPDIRPNLRRADLRTVNLSAAVLSARTMFMFRPLPHEADLSRSDLSRADFRHAKLVGVDLSESKLTGANLSGADLRQSNLSEARLIGADLNKVNLSKANLIGTDFSRASLNGAVLSEADLSEAAFIETNLNGANFYGTTMATTVLGGIDLSVVKGLDNVNHSGPSVIDIDTIYRSRGDIPEMFLRGAGAPDSMIEFARSLVASEKAIDFYSCFISHSSRDQDFAQRLYNELQREGVRCWFAPEDMKTGAKIRPTLDQSVRMHDKLLIILSENSIGSDWVEQEVETALARERQEKRTVLFPIRLDDTVMEINEGWPALIRNTRHIGDFRNWKDHDAYQQAFSRLLRDLKAENAGS